MIFNWIQRKRHAKGFGIHSPFAFHFVTGVIYEKHAYNAFFDIAKILCENGIQTTESKLHHLSYRLIRYFRPEKILEINSGKGINSLYICHSDKQLVCRCVETDDKNRIAAKRLLESIGRKADFLVKTDRSDSYNGIFLYLKNIPVDDTESLFSISKEEAFWVVSGIKSHTGKHFWKKIVEDKRVAITFDMKELGIAILKKSHHKSNYLI